MSVIVPAYNEEASITTTLAAMRAVLTEWDGTYEVIAVIDGDDGTADIVREIMRGWPQLRLDATPGRHGKGHGIRRGMRLATGAVIGFIDADYKTPLDEAANLLPWLGQGYDVVIGSRGLPESRIDVYQPWYRQIGSRGFGLCMHTLVGLWDIVDTQCGFKFFTQAAARDIFKRTRIDGYMCDVEILVLAQQLGYRVKEVGIRWRDDGDSRLDLVQGNVQNAIDLFRIRFRRA